jgi:hypothetical protein
VGPGTIWSQLLNKKSLEQMFTPYISIAGYGWAIDRQFGRPMISHNGMVDGFVSNIARYPQDKVTIVVLANLDTAPIGAIAKDLAAIVFGQPYQMPAARHVISLTPQQLRGYAGRFRVEVAPDIVIETSAQPHGLLCKVQGQSFILQPESPTQFSSEDAGAVVSFDVDSAGRVNSLTFNGQFKASRLP